jgi:hypothetical protein
MENFWSGPPQYAHDALGPTYIKILYIDINNDYLNRYIAVEIAMETLKTYMLFLRQIKTNESNMRLNIMF